MTEPDLAAVEEHRKAQEADYGKYVAAEVILINGVRAFNPGDPVPVGHVEREVVALDQVTEREPVAEPATVTTASPSPKKTVAGSPAPDVKDA